MLCQRFWELACLKLGDILGVEKTEEKINVDTLVVGWCLSKRYMVAEVMSQQRLVIIWIQIKFYKH